MGKEKLMKRILKVSLASTLRAFLVFRLSSLNTLFIIFIEHNSPIAQLVKQCAKKAKVVGLISGDYMYRKMCEYFALDKMCLLRSTCIYIYIVKIFVEA